MESKIESARVGQMIDVLNELNNDELLSMLKEANSYDGSYGFVDGFYMQDFLQFMIEGKSGSGLVQFVQDIVSAVNDYDGSDGIEDALWGYFDGYTLEIKDESDIVDEARDYYIEDLANDIIENGRTRKFDDLPYEVEELLDRWDCEDECGWIGAGDYVAYDQKGNEVETRHFTNFDDYFEWTENNELWSFDCVETDE